MIETLVLERHYMRYNTILSVMVIVRKYLISFYSWIIHLNENSKVRSDQGRKIKSRKKHYMQKKK